MHKFIAYQLRGHWRVLNSTTGQFANRVSYGTKKEAEAEAGKRNRHEELVAAKRGAK